MPEQSSVEWAKEKAKHPLVSGGTIAMLLVGAFEGLPYLYETYVEDKAAEYERYDELAQAHIDSLIRELDSAKRTAQSHSARYDECIAQLTGFDAPPVLRALPGRDWLTDEPELVE